MSAAHGCTLTLVLIYTLVYLYTCTIVAPVAVSRLCPVGNPIGKLRHLYLYCTYLLRRLFTLSTLFTLHFIHCHPQLLPSIS